MVIKPKLLVFDIDGVLTDGRTLISASGLEQKFISFRDLDAITRLQRGGTNIAFVTGESGSLVDVIAARFGIGCVVQGSKDKLTALQALASEQNISLAELWYVGDSDRDAPALRAVGSGFTPADGTRMACDAADVVLQARGGAGVAEEIERLLMGIDSSDVAQVTTGSRIILDSIDAQKRLINEYLPVLAQVAHLIISAIKTGHKLFLFGNCEYTADAQRIAAEFMENIAVERNTFSVIAPTFETSIRTDVSNHQEFEDVFGRQVRAIARAGDIAIGISTNGNSVHMLKALEDARKLGVITIGFTSDTPGQMKLCCDICFAAPANVALLIQQLHLLAWYAICELVVRDLAHCAELRS